MLERTTNGFHPSAPDIIAALHERIADLEQQQAEMQRRLDALTAPPVPDFSPRENEIMTLIEAGHVGYKELARMLCIEESTVKTHLYNMRYKIGARSMGELLAWRIRTARTA